MNTNYDLGIYIFVANVCLSILMFFLSFKLKHQHLLFKRNNRSAFYFFLSLSVYTLILLVSDTISKFEIMNKIEVLPESYYDGSSSSIRNPDQKVWYFKTNEKAEKILLFYKQYIDNREWYVFHEQIKTKGLVLRKSDDSEILLIGVFREYKKKKSNFIMYKLLSSNCINDNHIGLKPYMMGPHELLDMPKDIFCLGSNARKNGVNLPKYIE